MSPVEIYLNKETDTNLKLQVGELEGEKEIIEIEK
jgi:hypothetical protein